MNEQEKKENWKVTLSPNNLTENPNDFVAIVSTAGETRTIGDIVKLSVCMQITIHRGINQIGGCITKIATAAAHVLFPLRQAGLTRNS
jgi:hypothetical protein